MKRDEVMQLFWVMNYTYPNFNADSEEKIDIWHDLLKDVPFERAQRNLRAYIMDANNKYPPHPGELAKTKSDVLTAWRTPLIQVSEEEKAKHAEIIRKQREFNARRSLY